MENFLENKRSQNVHLTQAVTSKINSKIQQNFQSVVQTASTYTEKLSTEIKLKKNT